jgi:hypothetical protein
MPIYLHFCANSKIFCTEVGINMHSRAVHEMYYDLKNFSPFIIEGDYGGYDTSMPLGISYMANSVIFNIAKSLGYNSKALKIVQGLLSDGLHPILCLDNAIFCASGFQPSGKYATAEDNSLRGLLLILYAFMIMCTPIGKGHKLNATTAFSLKDWKKLLLPKTYGDDMLCSVKEEVSKYFNNLTYSVFVDEVYGMEFTTASKGTHDKLFMTVDEISFLKRKFVYSNIFNRIVAPLDDESFIKSMTLSMKSNSVSRDTVWLSSSCSCLQEWIFKVQSKNEFDSFRERLILTLCKKGVSNRLELENLLPSFQKIYNQITDSKDINVPESGMYEDVDFEFLDEIMSKPELIELSSYGTSCRCVDGRCELLYDSITEMGRCFLSDVDRSLGAITLARKFPSLNFRYQNNNAVLNRAAEVLFQGTYEVRNRFGVEEFYIHTHEDCPYILNETRMCVGFIIRSFKRSSSENLLTYLRE